MDLSLTPTSSRNFTCPKQLHAADNSDKISTLPDAVLSYILSLVPTKDAVRTSVLSKRWKEVCLSIPQYEFDEASHGDRVLLVNFLNRVIHRDTDISKLSISCRALDDASLLHALLCNVKELNLSLYEFNGPFVFPSSACSPESLISFKLKLCYSVLNLPSNVNFSRLETLHFECVTFPDDPSIQQLFSNCSKLEHLVIDRCKWKTHNVIHAPKLRSLTIHEELKEYFTVSKNVIRITAPELQFVEYNGGLENEYSLIESSSLALAYIHVCDLPRLYDNDRIVALRAFGLLTKLKNVRCLRITTDTVEVISNYDQECLLQWPDFKNLTELEITDSPMDLTCYSLLSILSKAHCLQSLTFSEGIYIPEDEDYEDWEWDSFPECFSSHLRNIHVSGFCGNPFEISSIQFLLQHAMVLDRMVISFSARSEDSENEEVEREAIREMLLELPRGSISCRIDFS